MRRPKSSSEPIAEVCLYGTRSSGYAYLAAIPGPPLRIVARGGWDRSELQPDRRFTDLTTCVGAAKDALRKTGVHQGAVIVFFPGGEQCSVSPIEAFEAVGDMKLAPAPMIAVSADAIAHAVNTIEAPKTERRR
jgi:hypothetical protein